MSSMESCSGYVMTILSFSRPDALTSSGRTSTSWRTEEILPTSLRKRSSVALMPMTTGIASNPSASLPFRNFCIMVVALAASLSCMPRCASSMIAYRRSPFFAAVFCNVCQIV